jgi:hypothetical protein
MYRCEFDELRPPREGQSLLALVLAVALHLFLIAGIVLGVPLHRTNPKPPLAVLRAGSAPIVAVATDAQASRSRLVGGRYLTKGTALENPVAVAKHREHVAALRQVRRLAEHKRMARQQAIRRLVASRQHEREVAHLIAVRESVARAHAKARFGARIKAVRRP